MENRPGSNPARGGTAVSPPEVDGHVAAPVPPAKSSRGRISRVVLFPVLVVIVLAIAGFAYRYVYNSTHYVYTDNAQISGSLIQVGALNAGEVSAVNTDIGQHVTQGQVIARVSVPMAMSAANGGTAKLGFSNTENQQVDVTSPLNGVVVARMADPGSTVAPGQAIIAVVDPTALYVTANVNETDIDRIKVGEPVDVSVDSLGVTLPGRVEAITPASAGSFSLIPSQNSSGNYTKVVQVVPVKISVDYGNLPLIVGSSVEVNIHVQ
ncbi:MAG: HlyD family secretion protein [Chloroflexota bacterium]